MKKSRKRTPIVVVVICIIVAALIAVFLIPALSPETKKTVENNTTEKQTETTSWKDYNGKRIGVLTGPLMEDAAKKYFPDSEYLLFNSYPDCITALLSGKIDAYLGDEPGLKSVHAENPQIDYIHDRITENNYSFAFRKNDPESAALCEELNAFLADCWKNGTMQELDDIWFGTDESRKLVDMSGLTGENGTVKVVTTSTDAPFSYIKDGKNVGYDIDLVVRFCKKRGYALELGDVDFAGRIPAIESKKYDFTTDMNVTPEREEQVLFSAPTSKGGIVLAVLSKDLATGVTNSIVSSATAKTLDDLATARIGVNTGTYFDVLVKQTLPDAKIEYFNSTPDIINSLSSGKIDAFAVDEPALNAMMQENDQLTAIPQYLDQFEFGFIFPKSDAGQELCEKFNEFLRDIRSEGRLEELNQKWVKGNASEEMPDYKELPATNGTLSMATSAMYVPFSYVQNDRTIGFDIELAALFCERYGYGLKVSNLNYDAILPSVQSGKFDFGGDGITITAERGESVLFSEPYYSGGTVLAVLKDKDPSLATGSGFFSSIRESFLKTFIREDRYKLFLSGIATTMVITLFSILFGTALGFAVFMLCRNGNIIANAITKICIWLVQGTPAVVLLMILYYVIFGSVSISGVAVAVIGFTLTFGAAVFGLLKMGVGTIDRGQYEAAYALGHSNRHTFFKIILPQVIPHILPSYKSEIISLLKATAIVGYIAVQDLTKMGEIVRSRTYEAFFPLIAVTIIYFVLEGLLGFIISRITINTDPKKRSRDRILKGVKLHD